MVKNGTTIGGAFSMCKDGVNLNEAQLSVRFLEDMAKLMTGYLAEWQELMLNNNAEELIGDFESVGQLSLELKKQLHKLRHKLEDYEVSMEEKVTITSINNSDSSSI